MQISNHEGLYVGTNLLNDDNPPGSYQSTVATCMSGELREHPNLYSALHDMKGKFIEDRNRSSYRQ